MDTNYNLLKKLLDDIEEGKKAKEKMDQCQNCMGLKEKIRLYDESKIRLDYMMGNNLSKPVRDKTKTYSYSKFKEDHDRWNNQWAINIAKAKYNMDWFNSLLKNHRYGLTPAEISKITGESYHKILASLEVHRNNNDIEYKMVGKRKAYLYSEKPGIQIANPEPRDESDIEELKMFQEEKLE